MLADPPLKGEGKGLTLDIPLGPEIGQCCGGRVEVSIRRVGDELAAELNAAAEKRDAELPRVYLFGGGHVGHALASALVLLPVHVVVVETRADALEGMPDGVEARLTPVPEEMVRDAPAGAAFVVLTHDHALDFLIVGEALGRADAAYVGMIGSKTKKDTFFSWFIREGGGTEAAYERLISPIGGSAVRDKRPAVIAALAASEIMKALATRSVNDLEMPSETYRLFSRAIVEQKQITCIYRGMHRELSPVILGHTDGQEKCLAYQTGGESASGLPAAGEWRCLELTRVRSARITEGSWRVAAEFTRPQNCVAVIGIALSPACGPEISEF